VDFPILPAGQDKNAVGGAWRLTDVKKVIQEFCNPRSQTHGATYYSFPGFVAKQTSMLVLTETILDL